MKPKTYEEAGVSIERGDSFARFIASFPSAAVSKSLGGFAGGMRIDLERYRRPHLFSTTDGVGTKILVAQGLGRYDTLGIDLVAMCVNDLVVHGAVPVQFLDYIAVGKARPELLQDLIRGVIRGCELAGCELAGGETAEMPDVYGEEEFDLAGFAVGIAEEDHLRPRLNDIRPGDLLIGLPSTGIHANGLSLARKVLPIESGLWPELLKPTRIYVPEIRLLLDRPAWLAAAHITGGGLEGNLKRVIPPGLRIRWSRAWPVPEIFGEIRKAGVDQEEMERVFNMGLGMVLVVARDGAETVTRTLDENGVAWHEAGDLAP